MKKLIYTLLSTALLTLLFSCSNSGGFAPPKIINQALVGKWTYFHNFHKINYTLDLKSDGSFTEESYYPEKYSRLNKSQKGSWNTMGGLMTLNYEKAKDNLYLGVNNNGGKTILQTSTGPYRRYYR